MPTFPSEPNTERPLDAAEDIQSSENSRHKADIVSDSGEPTVGSATNELVVVDPSEAARLDARYQSFLPFAEWARVQVDGATWDAKFSDFVGRRDRSSRESLAHAVEVALRAAAVDTGAIEGLYQVDSNFTVSVATRDPGWEQKVEAMGSTFQTLFQSQLRAYELAQQLAQSPIGVVEGWIRQLHIELCKSQRTYRVVTAFGVQEQDLPLGQYKQYPNHVRLSDGSFHAYAPVDATPHEMQRLVAQLGTDAFISAHPMLQAAYAHFALVAIHPFADGNGRVARALASTFLCKTVGVPLVIFADQKLAYFTALEAADSGQLQAFADFVFLRCLDSLDFVSDRLGASAQAQSERLATILRGSGRFTPAELDQIALNLLELVSNELASQTAKLVLPTGVQCGVAKTGSIPYTAANYRVVTTGAYPVVVLSAYSASPQVLVDTKLVALAAHRSENRYICAIANLGTGRVLEARTDDLVPQPTSALKLKVSSWVDRTLAEILSDMGTALANAVEQRQ